MSRMVLLLAALVPLLTHAQADPFLDVLGHPHSSYVEFLHSRGIVEGYGYGIFRPDITINRAEFLKILMLTVYGEEVFSTPDLQCFVDFLGEEQWFWVHACAAKGHGIIDGYPDGTFHGERNINLAEALKITIEAQEMRLPSYPGGPPDWYDPYFDVAASKRIFDEFPYNPGHLLTRSEMAVLIVMLVENIKSVGHPPTELDDDDDDTAGVAPVCGNGILEAGEGCDDGNNEDGDGCSSICIVVPEPIRHAALRITQRPFGSLEQSEGSDDVLLFAFDAVAGRQDAVITGLMLTGETGNLSQAQNFRLRIDSDGDGEVDDIAGSAASQGDFVTFPDISIPVRDGEMKRVELIADLIGTAAPATIAVGFAVDRPQYILAVGEVDGRELTGIDTDSEGCDLSICWISVFTESAREVTALDRGNLYVTQDSVPVRSHQLRAGELSDVLLRVKFRAEGEDIEVTDIAVSGGSDNIDYLELYQGSSSSSFASARALLCDTPASGQFCAKQGFVVPQDAEITILARTFIRPDAPADMSGDSMTLFLTAGTSPQPAVQALGRGSDDTLDQNDGDSTAEGEIFIGRGTAGPNTVITGPTHDLVASNIISIENAHDDPDNTRVPLGNVTFSAFRFTASSKVSSRSFPVRIRDLAFMVAAGNVEIDPATVALYNPLNPNATKACSASAATGNITVTCSNLEGSALGTTISQGSSVILALRANIVDAQTGMGASTLQATLQSLGNRSNGGTIEWDDGTTTFDWVDVNETRVRSTLYRSE